MRNLAMLVSYDGTNYEGFQTQPSGNTIQDKLEKSVLHLTGENVKISGSGRTDAGVHAWGQVISFTTSSVIPLERWDLAMNTRLPRDIMVRYVQEVPMRFDARKSALQKTYRYFIQCGRHPDLFMQNYQFHHPRPLDVEAMRTGLAYLVGEHDFTSYCSSRTTKENRIRTIHTAEIKESNHADMFGTAAGKSSGKLLTVEICGNGFLYYMVRIIVGTLLKVGQGKMPAAYMRTILEGRDRSLAGPTAVAQGLMLWDTQYEDFKPFT